jgi:hypothetical protein
MGNRTKVTYTLDRNVIDYIRNKSRSLSITHSRFVAESILSGYEMLLEGYDENDHKPIVGVARKRSHTIPITLSLPTDLVETLNWFSRILNCSGQQISDTSIGGVAADFCSKALGGR